MPDPVLMIKKYVIAGLSNNVDLRLLLLLYYI